MWNVLVVNSGTAATSASQSSAEQLTVGRLPVRFGKGVEAEAQLVGRPQQPDAVLDRAVVEHQARCRKLHRRHGSNAC